METTYSCDMTISRCGEEGIFAASALIVACRGILGTTPHDCFPHVTVPSLKRVSKRVSKLELPHHLDNNNNNDGMNLCAFLLSL
jgi:hypothetical protein